MKRKFVLYLAILSENLRICQQHHAGKTAVFFIYWVFGPNLIGDGSDFTVSVDNPQRSVLKQS
jgi:hypothetical protein